MEVKKNVITGGPCSGKTTTVEALKSRGFPVVQEASRLVIEEELKRGGDVVPWKRLSDFNIKVTALQLEMESRLTGGVYFLDRGVIDNLAYCAWGNINPPLELKKAARQVRYGKIFLLLPLEIFKNDPARKESREDQLKLTALIKKAYQESGYPVAEVPPFPVEERVEFILAKV